MASPRFRGVHRFEMKNNDDFNSNQQSTSSKKPFNKKLWRQKQYKSKYGNANEGHLLDHKRKVVKDYRKMLHREGQKYKGQTRMSLSEGRDAEATCEEETSLERKRKSMPSYLKAKLDHEKKMEDKRKKMEEIVEAKKAKVAAIQKYKEKKFARYGKLSKRTKKGQPVMRDRMELLLESLEKQLASERT